MSSEAAQRPIAWYRHAPYLLFFPIGGLLAALGVMPWTAFAFGPGPWRPELHAITEVQGALTCFVVGFLFTFIPRRTGTAPPRSSECFAALGLVVAPGLLALLRHEQAAHLTWGVLALFLAAFVLFRIPPAVRAQKAVAQLLWLPVSFAMGVGGAMFATLASPSRPVWMAALGTSLIWQGVFCGLVMGIGGMLLPMLLHREPYKGDVSLRSWVLHAIAAAAFVASFAVEWLIGLRAGYGLRALVSFLVLLIAGRMWRWPRARGLHRRLAWIAVWMLPIGFACVAIWPVYRIAMLHLVFLSGFMLLTLSVASHVAIAHGGRDPLLLVNPPPLFVMGAAVLLAVIARILVSVDPTRLRLWVGVASSLFLVALASWAWWVLPRLKPVHPDEDDRLPPTGPTSRNLARAGE